MSLHLPGLAPGLSWSINLAIIPLPLFSSSHTNTLTSPRFTLVLGLPVPLAAAADAYEGTVSSRRPCSEAPCLAAWTCSHHRKKDQAADPPLIPWGLPLCWTASLGAEEKKVQKNFQVVKKTSVFLWTSPVLTTFVLKKVWVVISMLYIVLTFSSCSTGL